MALENVEYTKRGTIDWAGLTNKIAEGINQIGVDQRKAREENERVFSETNSLLNKPLNLEKQTLTNFVLNGADDYKKYALDLKKQLYDRKITSSEYKRLLANSQEYWQNFAEQVKTADDRFKLYQERNTPDANGVIAASDAENFLMEQYLNAADLNNKKMVIGKDGAMYLQAINPETGYGEGELIDYRDFARPENMQINRVDLSTAVDGMIGNWKSVETWKDLGRGGEISIDTIKNQPDYQLSKVKVATALTSNPKSAVSILVDNGVVDQGNYYTSDVDGQQRMQQAVATAKAEYEKIGKQFTDADKKNIELSFVKFEKNSAGEFIPVLTEDQINAAKDRVAKEVDMQVQTAIDGSAKQQWASSYGGGSGGDDAKVAINAYIASADAVTNGDFAGFDTDNYSFEHKKPSKGKPYVVVKKKIKDSKSGAMVVDKSDNGVKVYSPDGMTQYLRNVKGNVSLYHKGKDDYKKLYGKYYYDPNNSVESSDPLGLGIGDNN